MIQTFRKKPIEVEAIQLLDDINNHNAVIDWIRANGGKAWMPPLDPCIYVELHEGAACCVELGDWIIRMPSGEFLRCLDAAFVNTYEPVSAEDGAA